MIIYDEYVSYIRTYMHTYMYMYILHAYVHACESQHYQTSRNCMHLYTYICTCT